MKTKQTILILYVSLFYVQVLAQVDTAWVRRYHGAGFADSYPTALSVDASGNVYVTGYIYDRVTLNDYTTIKYAPNGDTLWVRRYQGPNNAEDAAAALAVDESGNVYVTGSSGIGTSVDYVTIKYAPNGDSLWVSIYNGPGNNSDYSTAVAVDRSGNVYVTGNSYGSGTELDYATIKYAPNGDTLWVRRYNGPGSGHDYATGLAVDGTGNVYVTGYSYGGMVTTTDYTTIKYAPNGDTIWVRRYNGPNDAVEEAVAMVLDNSGNVYVTGKTDAFPREPILDYTTIKYAPNGDTLWVRMYNDPQNSQDFAKTVAVDYSGNVLVTGSSYGGVADYVDYATIKYGPNGDSLWLRKFTGTGNSWDEATALAVDKAGNVFVTGSSYNIYGEKRNDYATIKYAPNGDSLAVRLYNGPGNDTDYPTALAVDDSGNVYVTGYSWNGFNFDYATIKYVHFGCLAKSGDANNNGKADLGDIIFQANWIFKDGPLPVTYCTGDVDGNGSNTYLDLVYLINYLFKNGPRPIKSGVCCL